VDIVSRSQEKVQCEVLKVIGQTLHCEVCTSIGQTVEDSSGHIEKETTDGTV